MVLRIDPWGTKTRFNITTPKRGRVENGLFIEDENGDMQLVVTWSLWEVIEPYVVLTALIVGCFAVALCVTHALGWR